MWGLLNFTDYTYAVVYTRGMNRTTEEKKEILGLLGLYKYGETLNIKGPKNLSKDLDKYLYEYGKRKH